MAAPQPQATSGVALQPAAEKASVLVVDDHTENLVALEALLEELDVSVVRAQTGEEALRRLLDQDFACILLDVQLPGIDGYEAARLIRQRERSRHIPIIFLTAIHKSDVHVFQGYAAGAVDYVVKPFNPDVLRAKVSALVELWRKNRQLEAEVVRRQLAEEEVRSLNRELERRVRERTAALEAANRELKREITERERAQNQIEALNQRLQRAMTETHHRVKNNLQTIAAMVDMRLMDGESMIPSAEIRRLGGQVRTLAAVHDILTHEAKDDGQAHHVSVQAILARLVPMLQESAPDRTIRFEASDIRLPARQGSSLALIVNELISNSLKYGDGTVHVRLQDRDDRAVLQVVDEGPGFPEGFSPEEAANTGLELVDGLGRWDLGATIRYENGERGGACVTVEIPLESRAPVVAH